MPDDARSIQRPGVLAGLAVACGAWAGATPGLERHLTLAGGAVVAAGALLAVVLLARRRRGVRLLALAAAFVATGLVAGLAVPRAVAPRVVEDLVDADVPVHFVGRLVAPVTRRLAPPRWRSSALQPRLTLVVELDAVETPEGWVPAATRVQISGEDVPIESMVGDEVEGRARLLRPRAPANPGELDARPRLARAGIAYLGALERGSLATLSIARSWARRAESFRAAFTGFVRERVPDADRAALVAALAVGERGGVSTALAEDFNTSGLAHVLSISGLHLAVAVLVLYRVLRRLFGLSGAVSGRIAPRRLAALIALPATAAYVVLIGAPPPALRAGIGAAFFLCGIAAGRATDGLNTLGWCLAVVAWLDPRSLAEPSTQLSFAGVLGLVVLAPRLRALVPVAKPAPDAAGFARVFGHLREGILQLVLTTAAATLATAPITAAYFERASLVAALANVAAWPASTLIVPAGATAAVLFAIAPPLAAPLVAVAGACAWLLAELARAFAAWPAAAVHVAPPGLPTVAAYALAVWSLVNLRQWRPASVVAGLAVAGGVFAAGHARTPAPDGRLEVTFLSVGQGDAAFVRFPRGAAMLVDAGGEASGRFDPGEKVVTPFLRARGVSRLDVIAASHPHPDHIGGLPAVLARFPTAELWHDGDGVDEGPLAQLLEVARETGARPVEFIGGVPAACKGLPPLDESLAALALGDPRCAAKGPVRELDGVAIEVLHPLGGPTHAAFPELGENDNSLVLRLTYGDVRVLLPGDVEREGEEVLLARSADLSADILKAPHHGSRTSSTEAFVRRVGAKHVVFCVGEHNQWGFPAREVQDRYAAAGCRAWRTDRDGAVTFRTDGHRIDVEPFRGADW